MRSEGWPIPAGADAVWTERADGQGESGFRKDSEGTWVYLRASVTEVCGGVVGAVYENVWK